MLKIIILLFITTISVYGNDSRMISIGNTEIVSNNDCSIQIVNEKISIYMHVNSFEINVEYEYYNYGEEQNIIIGFPIYARLMDYDKEVLNNQNFISIFNNLQIDNFEIHEQKEEFQHGSNYIKWFNREVTFLEGKNHSTVSYHSEYSHRGFTRFLGYILGSAVNWKDDIKKLEIYIYPDDDILLFGWKIAHYNRENPPGKLSAISNGFFISMENYYPKNEDIINFNITHFSFDKYYFYNFDDYEAEDGWVWDKQLLYENKNELVLYLEAQLSWFINSFYIYHAYKSQNKSFGDYIVDFRNNIIDNKKTENKSNQKFLEENFNDLEKKNIEFLNLLMERLYGKTFVYDETIISSITFEADGNDTMPYTLIILLIIGSLLLVCGVIVSLLLRQKKK